jgi:hypothetical protein
MDKVGDRKRDDSPGVKNVRFRSFGFLSAGLNFMLHVSRKGPKSNYFMHRYFCIILPLH